MDPDSRGPIAAASNADACVDCNTRGLCDECAANFTLCGHTDSGGSGGGYGQCFESRGGATTEFYCGTPNDPNGLSTDGYDYCGTDYYCPCEKKGCSLSCSIEDVCWDASVASGLTDYEPVFSGGDDEGAPVPAPTPEPDACADSTSWSYIQKKKQRDCAYVAKNAKRCKTKFVAADGVTSREACPESCDTCDCAEFDSASWFYKKTSRNCEWAAKKSKRCKDRRVDSDGVSSLDACPVGCGVSDGC